MPHQPNTARWLITLRLARSAVEYINRLALEEGIVDSKGHPIRSEMLRILLAYAVTHWRKGWRPK